jgi:CheY-like chemotaxis protein
VVLLDLGLPEMNAYNVARFIRALPEMELLRLVALTGYGQAEDKQRRRDAGFADLLIKRVDFLLVRRALG